MPRLKMRNSEKGKTQHALGVKVGRQKTALRKTEKRYLNSAFDELPSTCSGPEPVKRQARQSRNYLIVDFRLIKWIKFLNSTFVIPKALHLTPYTLHPTPYTLHLLSYTAILSRKFYHRHRPDPARCSQYHLISRQRPQRRYPHPDGLRSIFRYLRAPRP